MPDPGPSLYVYEQALADGTVIQRGLIGALRLSPPEAGVVRPHEDVAPGPVEGRLQLMEATQANLEPIFLLHDGGSRGASARLIDETADGRPPLVDAVTGDGIRHRLWAISRSRRAGRDRRRPGAAGRADRGRAPQVRRLSQAAGPPRGPLATGRARGTTAWLCWWTPRHTRRTWGRSTG